MYNNKKIFTLVTADIFNHTRRSNNLQQFYSENLSFFSLYKLPDLFDSTADYDQHVRDNNIKIPYKNSSYRSEPYTEKPALYEILTNTNVPQNMIVLNLFGTLNRFNGDRVFTNTNSNISKHYSLKLFQYDWDSHKTFLNNSEYLPIYVDSSSPLHEKMYNIHLSLNETELARIEDCIPGYTVFSPEDVVFLLWKKTNHVYNFDENDENSHQIYSNISYGIFDFLKENILNYDATQESSPYNFIPPSYSYPDYGGMVRNRSWWGQHQILEPILKDFITIGNSWDIFFFKNTSSQEYFTDLVNSNSKKKLKVLKAPSWKTKSSDKKIDFTYYTKNQCLKRQVSFMPYMNQYTILTDKDNLKKINFFSLVSCGDYSDLSNVSRSLVKLVEFLKLLTWKDGIKLYDPDLVEELYKEMYSGLNLYTDSLCQKLTQDQIQVLLECKDNSYSPFDIVKNRTLTASPKVDLNLTNKYKKIDLLYNENLKKLANNSILSYSRLLDTNASNIKAYIRQIEAYKQDLKENINNLIQLIKDVYSSANFIASNKSIYSTIKNKYYTSYNESLAKNDFSSDDFFQNLSKDNICLTTVSYQSESGNFFKLDSNSQSESFYKFVNAKNLDKSEFSIEEVEFVINKVVKIQIDSKNKFVYGGPYKVKVSKGGIHIALLYKHSLFGISGDNSLTIHPHTTSFQGSQSLMSYTRGCLGEATSLLYNSFEKNDLKLIVLSAMTWITSANSSDPWGKKYSWFIEASELKELQNLPLQEFETDLDVTEEDVETFLTQNCEEDDEDEEPEEFHTFQNDEEEERLLETLGHAEEITEEITEEISVVSGTSTNPIQPNHWHPNQFSEEQQSYVPAFSPQNTNS